MRAIIIVLAVVLAACDHPPQLAQTVDVEEMRRMLVPPDWTDAQWQQWCEQIAPGLAGHCSIIVQIDCPPDCGMYRLVREDSLARRLW